MSITRIGTERQRMSKCVIHNNTIYLCGQVAKDSNGDIKEQTQTMLDKVDDLLEQAVIESISFRPLFILKR